MNLSLDRDISNRVLKLALPVVLGMMSETILHAVDTAMVGRLGPHALAAVGFGGLGVWIMGSMLSSIEVGTQALAARRYGEERYPECGKIFDNARRLIFFIGLACCSIGFLLADRIFPIFSNDPIVVQLGIPYFKIRFIGIFFFLIIASYRGFFNGIGKTKLQMRVMIIANIVNVIFNYLLIFGKFGFPRLEVTGAGLASALGNAAALLIFLFLSLEKKYLKRYRYFQRGNLSKEISKSIVSLSIYPGIRYGLTMSGYLVFLWVAGRIGTLEIAASQVVVTILSLSFMPGIAFGIAAATLVGQHLGAEEPAEAEDHGWEAVKLGMIFMGFLGVLFIIFARPVMGIFTDDQEVIRMGIWPVRILGAVQAVDALAMVTSQALQGAGLTRWVMAAELLIHWGIFIPLTIITGLVLSLGIVGIWSCLALHYLLVAICMGWKFRRGEWKDVKI